MKLIIDIPKDKYEWIKKKVYPNYIDNAIRSGIALDELTNGEVFTSTYPNIEVLGDSESKVGVNLGNGVFVNFPRTWWNEKWGE